MKALLLVKTSPTFTIVWKCHSKQYSLNEIESINFRMSEENSVKLKEEDVNFAFEQAEKHLEGTIQEADILLNRISILLSIALGVITSLVGFIISEIESERTNLILVGTSAIAITYLAFPAYKLVENFQGHKYHGLGSQPALLLDEYYLITIPETEQRQISVKLRELKSYQARIHYNTKKNVKRWRQFMYSLKGMIYLPFLLIFMYFLMKILSNMF